MHVLHLLLLCPPIKIAGIGTRSEPSIHLTSFIEHLAFESHTFKGPLWQCNVMHLVHAESNEENNYVPGGMLVRSKDLLWNAGSRRL